MNTYRRNAVAAGILLLVATVGAIAGSALYRPFVGDPVDLPKLSANSTPIFVGAFIQLVAYAACPGIALALYPVLRKYGEAFALGSVAFRAIEATFYSVSVVGLLLLVAMSQAAVEPGGAGAGFQPIAAAMVAGRDVLGSVAGVAFFACGGLLYYWVLFQSAIVPRWLSAWGLIGAVLALGGVVLVLFQAVTPMSSGHIALNLPLAVQEMVLAVWLIAKGFDRRVAETAPVLAGSFAGARAA